MKKDRTRDGLVTHVMKFRPLKDGISRYIPYCDYGFHQGLCRDPEICEKRGCTHYYKLRIDNGSGRRKRRRQSYQEEEDGLFY